MPSMRFDIVANIPAPYRLHLYHALSAALGVRGYDCHVHFMARGHRDRPHWPRHPEIGFAHTFWRDYGLFMMGREWHFNPGLVMHLRKRKPEFLYVGGPYDTPTGLLVSLCARRNVRVAAIEPNAQTLGRIRGVVGAVKRSVLRRYDHIKVPGHEACRYLQLLFGETGAHPQPVVLPNLIDESRFRPRWEVGEGERDTVRARLGAESSGLLAVWPTRLIPNKGVCEFLSVLTPEMLGPWQLVLLGDGPLRTQVESVIVHRNLERHVRLHPYLPYEDMPSVYAAADLFVLPSLKDPNPLSVVEALHSGLPLLLSQRVGNFPEALEEGQNGWGFDPDDATSAPQAGMESFAAPSETLESMGRRSKELAEAFWSTRSAVARFLDEIGIPSTRSIAI